jgi:fatty acid desaturase
MVIEGRDDVLPDREKYWRGKFGDLFSADEIRTLGQPSLRDSVLAITAVWVEIVVLLAGANLLVVLPIAWAIPIGVVIVLLMGLRMNALGVLLHEASHGLLAKSRTLNDRLCNWTVAFWTVNSVEEYRPTHRLHHRYLGQERDPDRTFYLVPARHGALTLKILEDLFGVTAFRRATTRLTGTSTESGAPASLLARPNLLVGKLVTQIVILGQFVLFQGFLRGLAFYAVFWLVPIVCLFPMIVRLKTITEHYDEGLRSETVQWTVRSSCAGWIQDHFIGAKMEYHFEHHVVPTVPFRGLRKMHRRLESAGIFEQDPGFLSHGYVQFLTHCAVVSITYRKGASSR